MEFQLERKNREEIAKEIWDKIFEKYKQWDYYEKLKEYLVNEEGYEDYFEDKRAFNKAATDAREHFLLLAKDILMYHYQQKCMRRELDISGQLLQDLRTLFGMTENEEESIGWQILIPSGQLGQNFKSSPQQRSPLQHQHVNLDETFNEAENLDTTVNENDISLASTPNRSRSPLSRSPLSRSPFSQSPSLSPVRNIPSSPFDSFSQLTPPDPNANARNLNHNWILPGSNTPSPGPPQSQNTRKRPRTETWIVSPAGWSLRR